ncbi:MAG: uroporphyrinogen-III C-methyltransferase [Bacillota bacterium]|nr:uroporphyrinogen-III C-methyltransferase [Bacillota bacterium]
MEQHDGGRLRGQRREEHVRSRPGEVWLVGAGPGDPGLLTIRGRETLERAQVVVHDRLANPDLLRLAPRARFIDVGKSPDGRGYRQEEINRLLVDLAREGNLVVRLKGGDPFIFGRGGEEALALVSAGIPFRVIPGVTAASGCAAWAGVPLTHRGLASSLALVTGHEDPGKAPQVDWRKLATATDTLVVYMGVGRLNEIVEGLLAGGRRAEEPALLVQHGTRATQKVVRGTLADLPARAREEGVEPPALLVVGEVATLRDRLAWYEGLSLSGCRVALTRPRVAFAEAVADAFAEAVPAAWDLAEWRLAGAEVEVYHVLRLEPPRDPAELQQGARQAGRFRWVLFTSAPGVEAFFRALGQQGADARVLAGCRVGAVGPGTAGALERHGVRPDLLPQPYTVDALVREVCRELAPGDRVLLPRSDLAPSQAGPLLRAGAAEVREVVAYRTLPDPEEAERLARDMEAGRVDALVLTSASAARAAAEAAQAAAEGTRGAGGAVRAAAGGAGGPTGAGVAGAGREPAGEGAGDVEPPLAEGAAAPVAGLPLVVAIGPVTARACREAGWRVAAEAATHDRAGLLQAVIQAWRRHRSACRVAVTPE